MKKQLVKSLLIPFAALSLASCAINAEMPEVKDGEDTLLSSLSGKPSENDAQNVLFAVLGKLNAYSSYSKSSTNVVSAKKGAIDYVQNTKATMIKSGEDYYVDSSSSSSLVDMRHVALCKNDKVAYYNKDGEVKNSTYDDYRSVYGVTPKKLLTGQILNPDTILLSKLDKAEDDKYTYTYVLDKSKANDLLAHQSYMFGSLTNLPTYTDHTTFTLTIDGSYTPLSYSYSAKYTINVAVLGDMDCVETCEATFSSFNASVIIPDSEKLYAAINETPSKVDTNEVVDYGDLTVLVSALLDSDLSNGVALAGSLEVNGYKLPMKIKAKFDVNGLLNGGELGKMVDAELLLPTINGDISLLYHDDAIYLDLFGEKVAFALHAGKAPEIDFDNGVANINDIVEVSKAEGTPNTYAVSFKKGALSIIKLALKMAGLIGEDDDIDFALNLYVSNNRIAGVYADFKVNDKKAVATDFLYQDEYFSLPSLDAYATELSFSGGSAINIGPDQYDSKTGIQKNSNSFDIDFTFSTMEEDRLKALDLEATFYPSTNIKSILNMSTMWDMGVEIPGLVASLSKADYLDITLKDGILDLYSFAGFTEKESENVNDELIYHEEIDLNGKFDLSFSSLFSESDDNGDGLGFSLTDLFDALLVTASKEGIVISLDEDFILEKIDTLQAQGKLASLLIDELGEKGSYILDVLSLSKPISNIVLSIPFNDEEKASLAVSAYSVTITSGTWNPDTIKNTAKVNYFAFSVGSERKSPTHAYEYDSSKIEGYHSSVDSFIAEYDALLSSYELSEEYLTKLNELKAKYDALSTNIQYWINAHFAVSSSPADALIKTYNTDKKNADNFIKYAKEGKATADTYYAKLNDTTIAYINGLDETVISNYEASRKTKEETNYNAFVESVKAFEWKDASSMKEGELLSYFKSAVDLLNQKSKYLAQNDDVDAFENKVKGELAPLYLERTIAYVDALIDEYYNFAVTDGLDYDDIEARNALLSGLLKNYYSNFDKVVDFSSCGYEEKGNELYTKATKAAYYGNCGLGGYQKSIVKSINKKMADILAESDETKAEEAVSTMFNFFNDVKDYRKLCPNYGELYKKYGTLIDEIDDAAW